MNNIFIFIGTNTLQREEYHATSFQEQLVSENMVLTKKLDALEEFRIQREQLMAKFEAQERKQEETVKAYEKRLEDQERKHILEEDRCSLYYDIVVQLSESVQAISHNKISIFHQ